MFEGENSISKMLNFLRDNCIRLLEMNCPAVCIPALRKSDEVDKFEDEEFCTFCGAAISGSAKNYEHDHMTG